MVAVSNTSPLSNLSIVGRLDLLKRQFSSILIAEAVQKELWRAPDQGAKSALERALSEGWLQTHQVRNTQLAAALGNDLDSGEAEAIVLATEVHAQMLLIDRKGRPEIRSSGGPDRSGCFGSFDPREGYG